MRCFSISIIEDWPPVTQTKNPKNFIFTDPIFSEYFFEKFLESAGLRQINTYLRMACAHHKSRKIYLQLTNILCFKISSRCFCFRAPLQITTSAIFKYFQCNEMWSSDFYRSKTFMFFILQKILKFDYFQIPFLTPVILN